MYKKRESFPSRNSWKTFRNWRKYRKTAVIFFVHRLKQCSLVVLRGLELHGATIRSKLRPAEASRVQVCTHTVFSACSGCGWFDVVSVPHQQTRMGRKNGVHQLRASRSLFSFFFRAAVLRTCFSAKNAKIQLRAKTFAPTRQRFTPLPPNEVWFSNRTSDS